MPIQEGIKVLLVSHDKPSQVFYCIYAPACCLQSTCHVILTAPWPGMVLHQTSDPVQGVAPHFLQLCKSAAEEADQVALEVGVHVPMEALQQAQEA